MTGDEATSENTDIYEPPDYLKLIVERYEGGRYRNRFHGEGVAYFQGGHVYEGEFVSNVPMGQGRYTWLDGSSYEGGVDTGLRHGTGTHRRADGSVVYKGQWEHGKMHGKGVFYYNREGTSIYEGQRLNNCREGWGMRRFPSGSIYKGEWKHNARHGQGTMMWAQMRQQYVGTWHNGVQHGQGTHTWAPTLLRHCPGCQSNEYRGEFVLGLRHGLGTFHYADGAVYQGQWRRGQKQGQAKFIFSNGRVFEGEFVDDNMAEFPSFSPDGLSTPYLSQIRTHTPCGPAIGCSVLGCDIALNIGSLLEKFPETRREAECKQAEYAVLRYISELRSIYAFYSVLGHAPCPDHALKMSALHFCRLLKDCYVHHHGVSLAQLQGFLADDFAEEMASPFSGMLLRQVLSALVVVSYHLYHQHIQSLSNILELCVSKLMTDNVLPHAKAVKGLLYSPQHALVAGGYVARCWSIYQSLVPVQGGHMTRRQLLWLFKDLGLQDTGLTTRGLLEVMAAEDQDPGNVCNLELEVTFLEFQEVLLGCSEVKAAPAVKGSTLVDASAHKVEGDKAEVIQWFFSQYFFPAYEHRCLVMAEMERQRAQRQEEQERRKHQEEEEKHQEEEEQPVVAEREEGQDGDSTQTTLQTSSVSVSMASDS